MVKNLFTQTPAKYVGQSGSHVQSCWGILCHVGAYLSSQGGICGLCLCFILSCSLVWEDQVWSSLLPLPLLLASCALNPIPAMLGLEGECRFLAGSLQSAPKFPPPQPPSRPLIVFMSAAIAPKGMLFCNTLKPWLDKQLWVKGVGDDPGDPGKGFPLPTPRGCLC